MKTEVTRITERGQVSVPASVRKRLGLVPGRKICWEVISDQTCCVTAVESPDARLGAGAMRGFARTFRKTRATEDWMRDLRAGEAR